MSPRGIVFFDIDGTLVPTMSSSSFLARRFGHQAELDAAEARYARGELTNQEVSTIDAAGWRGTSVRVVADWLDELPTIDGTDTVVAWCHDHRIEPVLASLAWTPVSHAIARRHGFTANGGPTPRIEGGAFDGTVEVHFDEWDKRDRALHLAADRGIRTDRCCAIGDSRSDIPLFDAVPASLALNAGTAARGAATHSLDTTDLRDALPWLEAWERALP
ncbi:HAD family hydrolase [Curtobacterium aetherium]|uniref:HAD-IB family phosphatase n=1 Tax=Curtobacterium aetherium TaxID=2841594 RepID=A0ACD1E2Z6_9MICO|nr:HAD-IB family phosphatase [Curtobacterium sp. L6-1]QWS33245.1 HAD-IB family phosphatase [Curtobacterium sp. L6-1]